jgi:hypothetical protein
MKTDSQQDTSEKIMQKEIIRQLWCIYIQMSLQGIFSGYVNRNSDNRITFSTSESFGSLFVNRKTIQDYIRIFGKDL